MTVKKDYLRDTSGNTIYPYTLTESIYHLSGGNQERLDNIINGIRRNNVTNITSSSFYVKGTQTSSTNAWTGVLSEVSELYEGLTIDYWLPQTSASNVTLNLTLADGSTTGAINCYYDGTTRLSTQIPANNICRLVYQTVTISSTSYTGWWLIRSYYNDYSKAYYWFKSVNDAHTMESDVTTYSLVALNNENIYTSLHYNVVAGKSFQPKTMCIYDGDYWSAGSIYSTYFSNLLGGFDSSAILNHNIYFQGIYNPLTNLFTADSTTPIVTAPNGVSDLSSYFTSGKHYLYVGYTGSSDGYGGFPIDHPIYGFDGTNLYDLTMDYEILRNKPNIFSGTSEPTSTLGKDGDFYFIYK